ncbi:YheC/YheD family protein [Candidatus Clostridium stratigraminis]|uniref:YheC/YheD family protein n=1 Tax=Candidatus Clostridium stratigraminis TaxID=3381661 RepID=A0ABW8T6U7_9CLOT
MDFIKIIYKNSDYNTCYLTEEQNEFYCNGDKDKNINIKFGSLNINLRKVVWITNETDSNFLCLSEDLKSVIYIPDNSSLQLRKIEKNSIEIGPLVGIFINSKKIASLSEGKTDSVYEQISLAMDKLSGLSCFFSAGDIDWGKRLVKGLVHEDSRWAAHILPLPTVIYDRCFGSYGRKNGLEFRKRLGSEYHVINSMPKLTKWETICTLRKNPKLLQVIPKTSIYNSYMDLENALLTANSVYLKPDALYKGKGVYRVSKELNGSYKIEHRTETKNVVNFLPNLNNIGEIIDSYTVLGGGYLIQEEIEKAYYKDYPFDFRLLYQKDWQGSWQPSGIAVRIGAPGSIITSPRSGGAVIEFSKVLRDSFHEDFITKDGLYKNVLSIGREIVTTIEQEFGDCVELGLDMTIDINRKIWVIEVNGKPLKVSLKWLNNPALMARCYSRPIEYAVFLTGFMSANTEMGEY